MTNLIDADDLKRALVTNGFKNDIDMMMTLETINNATTIDAVPLDGSFLKMSRDDYLIYKRHWLYEHFDMEMEIQRSAMKSMGYEPAIKDAQPHWIPCSERLPEDSGDYLVCPSDSVLEDYSDFSEIMIMPYDADCEAFGWWVERYHPISLGYLDSDFNEFEVLAWMPLPKPYPYEVKE